MSRSINMYLNQILTKTRNKLLDYPDYFLWLVKKYYILFYILFGFASMLIILGIKSWVNKINQNNKQSYIEVYSDTITTLHPLVQSSHILDTMAQNLLYLPLLRVNSNSSTTNILLDAFSISNTYKDYTITIKNNAKWSNGESITTKDVAFTYDFIKTYYPDTPLGKALQTAKIHIINNYTLEIQLKNPYVGFIRELTYPIANAKLYQNKTIDELIQNPYSLNILTSGPYILNQITIDTVDFKAKLQPNFHIIWKYQRDPQTAYFEFISNKADAYIITNSNYDLEQRLRNNPNVILTKYPIIFEIKGLFFNTKTKNPYLKDIHYRRALLYLLNPSLFTNKFEFMPAYSIYPKQTKFFNQEVQEERLNSKSKLQEFSKILNNTGFDLAYLDTSSDKQIAQFIKDYLKHYNVDVVLNPINIEDFEYDVLQTHNFDVLLYGIKINADPDQSAFWHSKGNLNIISLKDSQVDKLLEQGLKTYNLIDRQSIYKQLQSQIITKKTVFIPLYHPNLYVAYHKNVKKLGINTESAVLTSPTERIFIAYPYMARIQNTNAQ